VCVKAGSKGATYRGEGVEGGRPDRHGDGMV